MGSVLPAYVLFGLRNGLALDISVWAVLTLFVIDDIGLSIGHLC